ncbi:MaoC/PaaZ C-terminal domain-containing protein [Pseudomonas typographi]|uniref:3-alpha,7-alpha, 12-alpha-trihydroxy-5-beta-cholest-24-enoyl-CoA hydratase n=1 Tax=Pseudomonas typographi TaxID=2715964 RepID=A0ABR7Z1W0_9PSED|nr:MaoC/PaaZ C-terminal domain-containing protein [Pseudomonas typographi]MBD1599364.1 3-alpha,7-alpha,12-alpha-trihydroxy-5-beta-cholest-24-enoyl-CoA hydratase [Pseudomonas typographi]
MPLDPQKLLAYPIPDVRQALTRRDVAFYALSVGLGQNPTDRPALNFVDPAQDFRMFPLMPVVLAYPGFWLGNPDTGVDALRLVLGEQRVTWRRPLPVQGEIIGRTRVTSIIDKGVGKGALLYSDKELINAATGECIAVTSSTTFLRGDGGCGAPTGPVQPAHAIPERAADRVVDSPTRPEQALYYRLNGDDNPLHADPAFARRAGFERPILHGLCTLGVAFHAVFRELADYRSELLRAMQVRFSAPVYPGETLRTEIWSDGSFRTRVLERDQVVLNNGRLTLAGQEGA